MATLKDLRPDVNLDEEERQEEATATKLANKAATELINFITDDGAKDRRINFRLNNRIAAQFSVIAKRKGITVSAALQQLVFDYVKANEELLKK